MRTIVWLKEPNDPDTRKPKTDKNNSDAAKRSRPLLGVQIVLGMKPAGADKWTGQVYNAEDGKTYSGNLTSGRLVAAPGLRARRPRLQEPELDQGELTSAQR